MKIYRFYQITKNEKNGENSYELYAITHKKKFAKRFQKERNMESFYTSKSSMSMEEYQEFLKVTNAYGHELKIEYLITSDVDSNGMLCTRKVEVLITNYESDICINSDPFMEICSAEFWSGLIPYKYFNKSLINALKTLEFHNFYKMFRDMYLPGIGDPPLVEIDPDTGLFIFPEDRSALDELNSMPEYDEDIDVDYDAPEITPDQLGILVSNFHRTFKKE